ncbi:MAG: DoxX family membrane protein [Pseudonocardia sp.]|nr:DoxX family membrane protein [Pseudonocardia sp.]
MLRTLPGPFRDLLLLGARLLVSFVMLAHVWDTFVGTGFTATAGVFNNFGIPIAIVATAFTLVAELVGSILIASGIFVTWAGGAMTFVMAGAIYFVHAKNGVFVKDGGWELVGMIIAVCIAIAATGPGRFSLDHLLFDRKVTEPPAPEPVYVTQEAPAAPAQRWANGTGGSSAALRAAERRTAAVRMAEHAAESASEYRAGVEGHGQAAQVQGGQMQGAQMQAARVQDEPRAEFGDAARPAPAHGQVRTPGTGTPAVGMASLHSHPLPARRPAPQDENTQALFTTRGN